MNSPLQLLIPGGRGDLERDLVAAVFAGDDEARARIEDVINRRAELHLVQAEKSKAQRLE